MLVHGFGDDSTVWNTTVDDLGADCACTAVDLPGHGRSPAPEESAAYEREALLASFDAVLDRIGPAVYVGHSLGGYLGLAHCITRPGVLKGLVLVAAGPGFRDAAAMQEWNDQVHLAMPRLDLPRVAATSSLHTDSIVINRLGEVQIPVGLVVGTRDRNFVGANDYMGRKLADVRRRTIDDGRHRLMRTHPTEIAGMVREVLVAAHSTPGGPT
jgi:pimeloyl-ACP methyl ester carboxylesterase